MIKHQRRLCTVDNILLKEELLQVRSTQPHTKPLPYFSIGFKLTALYFIQHFPSLVQAKCVHFKLFKHMSPQSSISDSFAVSAPLKFLQ